jgi:hypothetical protein
MDEETAQRQEDETEVLHEANDWSAVESLWRSYILQIDVGAQFRLACYHLFAAFDEELQTRTEMQKLLRTWLNAIALMPFTSIS